MPVQEVLLLHMPQYTYSYMHRAVFAATHAAPQKLQGVQSRNGCSTYQTADAAEFSGAILAAG